MAQYVFGILILLLLFREVLGYKELEKAIFIAAGIVIAVAGGIVEASFDVFYEFNIWIYRFFLILPSLIPLFIFRGRKTVIFGIGFCTIGLVYEITIGVAGIKLMTIGMYDDSRIDYVIASVISIIILFFIRCYMKANDVNLYSKVNEINRLLFIPAVLIIYATRINGMYGGTVSNETAAYINGINITKGSILGLLAFALFLVLVILVYQKRELNRMMALKDKCISEQTQQYKFAMNKERELRRFRHDYNAHMTAVSSLLADKDYDRLQEYIKNMGYFKEKFNLVSTGNVITDAVFNQYKELCDRDNITFNFSGKFTEALNMAETDICVLFSNLMSNAYEAALKCEEHRRMIRTQILNGEDNIFVKISNSVSGETVFKNGLPVTDKHDRANHGFGVENMLEVIDRNDGHIEWKQPDKGVFTAEIVLSNS